MSGALEKNQRLTLSCARLGSELEGVCSHEGMAVFVPGVLPGETAEVQIVKALPNYAFGRLVQVLEPSAQRAQPRCPGLRRRVHQLHGPAVQGSRLFAGAEQTAPH